LDLLGQRIVLRHAPLNWPASLGLEGAGAAARVTAALLTQQEWLPSLTIGSNPPATQASFTQSGSINMTPGAGQPAAPRAGFGGLMDAFGGGDPVPAPEPPGHLTAEWIEYEIRSPGREPKRIRRDVFDLIGPAARTGGQVPEPSRASQAALRRAMALAGETEVLLLASYLSPEFARHVVYAAVLNQSGTLREIVRKASAGALPELDLAKKLEATPGELYALALARTALSPVKHQVFLDRPNVFNFHRRMRADAPDQLVATRSLDIVANDVAARPGAGADAFRLLVSQGVADTVAEVLALGRSCGGCSPVANTSEFWVAAKQQGGSWVSIRQPDDPAWREVSLSADVRRRAANDVRAGYVVLVPRSTAIAGLQPVGWWRVDPTSGSTLGVMESGEGQAEYTLTDHVWSVLFPAAVGLSILGCIGNGNYHKANMSKIVACFACGAVWGLVASATAGLGMAVLDLLGTVACATVSQRM
jgi:hypothetical protein